MSEVILVYSTAPNVELAQRIAKTLVEEKLAACVSLLPGMTSVYRWEGKVEEASEISITIKTKTSCFRLLAERLKSIHPYDIPELVAVPVRDGLTSYLQWVKDETI